MIVKELFLKQKAFYQTNQTKSIDKRIMMLKKLKQMIQQNESQIMEALKHDLGKSHFEAYATEIGVVYDELNTHIKHLKKWAKPKKVASPIFFFKATSWHYFDPYGTVLIIGPFNYPFQLLMMPLIGAISGGNTAILKPSEHTPHISHLVQQMMADTFDASYLSVVDPGQGKDVVDALLDLPFDLIFFTGSTKVGQIVMERASKHLTPVILELGGKSPCIVSKEAHIKLAAKRIIWGKLINAGQTCVAPDYILVDSLVKQALIEALIIEIEAQYGPNIKDNLEYPSIVNTQSIQRLSQYLNDGNVVYGGHYDIASRYFEPTLIEVNDPLAPIMTDELFGPILPILTYQTLDEVVAFVESRPKPLALYFFSQDKDDIEFVLDHTHSGGVTINDTILHVSSKHLPFGGVGTSGIGAYHGKSTFHAFTHLKGVVKRSNRFESKLRYAPFKDRLALVKKIMK